MRSKSRDKHQYRDKIQLNGGKGYRFNDDDEEGINRRMGLVTYGRKI
jgi:hypothetical protein